MFVGILLRDPARDFGVEFESLRHREIFEINTRADKKTIGSHLKCHFQQFFDWHINELEILWHFIKRFKKMYLKKVFLKIL